MSHDATYGLWGLVIANTLVFISFAFSFFKPQSRRDWRTFGAFSAFIVALFVEMYGFPLTVYFLAGWIQTHYPTLDPFSHDAGHLWYSLLGFSGDPHTNGLHILSNVVIVAGFWLLASAWRVLYAAQRANVLAVMGPYARIRHPQYVAFILIMFGFLLQWPTILTIVMFPVLVVMYTRLAKQEEAWAKSAHGPAWDTYAKEVPPYFPSLHF